MSPPAPATTLLLLKTPTYHTYTPHNRTLRAIFVIKEDTRYLPILTNCLATVAALKATTRWRCTHTDRQAVRQAGRLCPVLSVIPSASVFRFIYYLAIYYPFPIISTVNNYYEFRLPHTETLVRCGIDGRYSRGQEATFISCPVITAAVVFLSPTHSLPWIGLISYLFPTPVLPLLLLVVQFACVTIIDPRTSSKFLPRAQSSS